MAMMRVCCVSPCWGDQRVTLILVYRRSGPFRALEMEVWETLALFALQHEEID
jgi:hypothetical protein